MLCSVGHPPWARVEGVFALAFALGMEPKLVSSPLASCLCDLFPRALVVYARCLGDILGSTLQRGNCAAMFCPMSINIRLFHPARATHSTQVLSMQAT